MTFITENAAVILVALVALSEVLALIPSIKSNSIFEIVVGVLKKFAPTKATGK